MKHRPIQFNEVYAKDYGVYRLERISESVEKFNDCGDWNQGIARIKCTNPAYKYEYFRPFSCKQWYLCQSCHQKRLLLLSEHLSQEVLLRLPHRQFVFTIPKLLRPYFKHDKKLFTAPDFIEELTQHIPPKFKHLIRYYELYSSRTKGKAKQVGIYEKFGIKADIINKTTERNGTFCYNFFKGLAIK